MRDTKKLENNAHDDEESIWYTKRNCVCMKRGVKFGRESEFGKIDRDNKRDKLNTCKRGFPTWLGVLSCARFMGFTQPTSCINREGRYGLPVYILEKLELRES